MNPVIAAAASKVMANRMRQSNRRKYLGSRYRRMQAASRRNMTAL
jgi:hypothetical protein